MDREGGWGAPLSRGDRTQNFACGSLKFSVFSFQWGGNWFDGLQGLYSELLSDYFRGCHAHVFAGHAELGIAVRLTREVHAQNGMRPWSLVRKSLVRL